MYASQLDSFTISPFLSQFCVIGTCLLPLPLFSFKLMAPQGDAAGSAQDIICFPAAFSSLCCSLDPSLFLCPLRSSSLSSCSSYSLCLSLVLSFFLSFQPLPPSNPPSLLQTLSPSLVLAMKMLTVGTGSSWPLSTTGSKSERCVCVHIRWKQ